MSAEDHDADVALLMPFRAGGIEIGFAIRALQGLRLRGYRIVLVDTTAAQDEPPRAKTPEALVELLDPTAAFIAQPRREYHVQSVLAVMPSRSIDYNELSTAIVARGSVLVADRKFADASATSDEHILTRIEHLGLATSTTPAIGVLIDSDRPRFTGLGLNVTLGTWNFGAPKGALRAPRTVVADSETLRLGRHIVFEEPVWPKDDTLIRGAMPTTSGWDVRIFGTHKALLRALGRKPAAWSVYHAVGPRDLDSLDFWVLGHDGNTNGPPDLAIDEAIAAGLIVILPADYSYYFGTGALYTTVRSTAAALAVDPRRFASQSRRAVAYATANHAESIVVSLSPWGLNAPTRPRRIAAPRGAPRNANGRFRALFVTSNGAGMGHLTRLLAIARTICDEVDVLFASLSQASPIVGRFGFPFVYIASSTESGLTAKAWNDYAYQRFSEELARFRPDVVVFDGTWIYSGLRRALREAGVPIIWSRRGMWKPHVSDQPLASFAEVSKVIEPGDFASEFDRGATSRFDDVSRISPITVRDRDELLSRTKARSELNINENEHAVLITLGSGALSAIDGTAAMFVEAFVELAPEWRVFVIKNPLADSRRSFPSVTELDYYPVVELATGFDVAISAAGYNSYHEWMMACVPAIWIPNLNTRTDDQEARARFAEQVGAGVAVFNPSPDAVRDAVTRILNEETRRAMRESLEARRMPNGAAQAGALIVSHLKGEGDGRE